MADDELSYHRVSRQNIATSDQIADDVVVDYDSTGAVVGVEFLSAAAAARASHYLALAAEHGRTMLRRAS